MKPIFRYPVIATIAALVFLASCGPRYEINYPTGRFTDSTENLAFANSAYDDYNASGVPSISLTLPLVFSSNRSTSGGKFDLIDYEVYVVFNQYDGTITLGGVERVYPFIFLNYYANTEYNEFGPFTAFLGGTEYFFFFASDRSGNMDIYTSFFNDYSFSGLNPVDPKPYLNKGLSTPHYEAYATMSRDFRQVLFCSNRHGGTEDIFRVLIPDTVEFYAWSKADSAYQAQPVEQLNSGAQDLYPYTNGNLLVFASNRDGGEGGFDLYYSRWQGTDWGEPVNFGPTINTPYDEHRPVIFFAPSGYFENDLMIFSSNRPGGKGGFDLYYVGIEKMMQQ
ncbi:MAG: hypothetical protein R6V75_00350 [Bacteroidales bacterium]